MAQNGLTEPAALPGVFIVFVYSATQVYARDPTFPQLYQTLITTNHNPIYCCSSCWQVVRIVSLNSRGANYEL